MAKRKKPRIVKNKYLPPGTIVLIVRPRYAYETLEEWENRCVHVVKNVSLPNRPPWNGK
jgi:hypothetical protein